MQPTREVVHALRELELRAEWCELPSGSFAWCAFDANGQRVLVWREQLSLKLIEELGTRQRERLPTEAEQTAQAQRDREERLRVRRQATEQLERLARLNRKVARLTPTLDVALVEQVRETVARGTSRERRAGARRTTGAVRAGRDDPSEPPPDDLTPLQRALLQLRAAIETAHEGGVRTLATFSEIATIALARALTGGRW